MMPYLRPQEVVEAATESTRRYLEFLQQHDFGVDRHAAQILRPEPEATLLMGKTQYRYAFRLSPHLKISPDSSAIYQPRENGALRIPVQIVTYDRQDGTTELVFADEISTQGGHLIVDFRWLIKRCLEWLEQAGGRIPPIESLRPHALDEQEFASWLVTSAEDISEEQRGAIRLSLTAPLGYVWGPPGTGKTNRVLAKAVRYLFEQGKKVLVLASTNLAVDNALSAILDNGVPEEKVARVGVPSEGFQSDHPACCEHRAFEVRTKELRTELEALRRKERVIADMCRLRTEMKRDKDQLRNSEGKVKALTQHQDSLRSQTQADEERCSLAQTRRSQLQDALAALRKSRNDLRIPELERRIRTLEDAYSDAHSRLSELTAALRRIRYVAWVARSKARDLNRQIESANRHIHEIQATLQAMRERRQQRLPRFQLLEDQIATAERELTAVHDALEVCESKMRQERTELRGVQEELTQCSTQIEALRRRVSAATARLADLQKTYALPVDSAPLQERMHDLQMQIAAIQDQMAQLEFDLTSKAAIGMTLDGYIGLSIGTSLQVDRVFIDEAGYAPVAKVLPVLGLRCPIVLLGDHLQLPPICENRNNAVITSYWGKHAVFLEDAYRFANDFGGFYSLRRPELTITRARALRTSFRFGPELADLLARHIYRSRFVGHGGTETRISVCHCEPRETAGAARRENHAEADAVVLTVKELFADGRNPGSVAVLTPYRNQARLLQRRLREARLMERVEVLNTHRAQGREWDYVLFSVSDTGRLAGVHGPHFTSSRRREGRSVLNTTISRVKKHLIVFLDHGYWSSRNRRCLLGDIARTASPWSGNNPSEARS